MFPRPYLLKSRMDSQQQATTITNVTVCKRERQRETEPSPTARAPRRSWSARSGLQSAWSRGREQASGREREGESGVGWEGGESEGGGERQGIVKIPQEYRASLPRASISLFRPLTAFVTIYRTELADEKGGALASFQTNTTA